MGLIPCLLAVWLAASPLAAQSPDEARRAAAAQAMDDLMWGRGPIGAPFTLTDHTGRPRKDTDWRGKLVLLYFGYRFCPDICPTDLQAIAVAIDQLGRLGRHVQPLFVTLDPERDTVEALAQYVPSFHPRLVGLTGSVDAIRTLATTYKVTFEKVADPRMSAYVIDHTAYIYLLDAQGRYLGFFPPGSPPERIVEIVRPHAVKLSGR